MAWIIGIIAIVIIMIAFCIRDYKLGRWGKADW